MAAENEVEQRSRQQRAVQAIISEKRAELDRYTSQFQSLERVEAEQKVVLEKMMNVSN
jgi:intraflagellar transport protein 20